MDEFASDDANATKASKRDDNAPVRPPGVRLWAIGCVWLAAALPATAQDMEPKAYSASPVGTTFLVVGASRSTGSVVFDPTLPLRDVNAGINGIFAGVGTTFSAFGKLALLSAVVPLASGELSGLVGEDARTITRDGFTDLRARFSINLRGNDAMSLQEFAKAPRRTIVGASLTLAAPTGEYDRTRLVNLGTNRWAFKPEFGIAVPKGRWDVDAYVGLWLFTANREFYPGTVRRTQEPVFSAQGHVSYTFRARLWLAVDGTWYSGGSNSSGRERAAWRGEQHTSGRDAFSTGRPAAGDQGVLQRRRVSPHRNRLSHDCRRVAVGLAPTVN